MTVNNCSNLFLVLLFCSISPALFSQPQKDAEVWTGVKINKRITENTLLRIRQEIRINDNVSSMKNGFVDIGVHYGLNKYLKISGNYRYINDGKGFFDHRTYTDLRLRYKSKPFTFSFRSRFQHETQIREKGTKQEVLNRNKFQITFDLDKKISPFISSEAYYDYHKSMVKKMRYTFGLDLDLKNRMELALFYRLQREINVANPTYGHILGIGYSYRIKGRLLKKKD
jgi:hypothetical protein